MKSHQDRPGMNFDLDSLKREAEVGNRYEKRLAHLEDAGQEVDRIKVVVSAAIENIHLGQRSFVIYGEPQSGLPGNLYQRDC